MPGAASHFIQGRFDGAFRRKSGRAAIGVSLELAWKDGASRPLLDVGIETADTNSYEAELNAAARLVSESTQLYTNILMASFPN